MKDELKNYKILPFYINMMSNFDIEKIANHYQIPIVVVMKDELKYMKPINTNYIINLESSKDGNGTHWMALKIENKDCV